MLQKRLQHWQDSLPYFQGVCAAAILIQAVTLPQIAPSPAELALEVVKASIAFAFFTVMRIFYSGLSEDAAAACLCRGASAPSWLARVRTPTFAYFIAMIFLMFDAHYGKPGFMMLLSPLIRAVFTVINKNRTEAAVANCTFGVVNLWGRMRYPIYGCGLPLPEFVLVEMSIGILIVFLAHAVEMLLWQEVFNEKRAKNEHSALTSILNATCDTIFPIDEELRIVGDNPRLAATLLRNVVQTLDGVDFMSLVADDDRGRVRQILTTQSLSPGEIASCFQMDLLDCRGRLVKVTGFRAQLMDVDGSIKHLLGLTEVQEELGAAVSPLGGGGGGSGASRLPNLPRAPSKDSDRTPRSQPRGPHVAVLGRPHPAGFDSVSVKAPGMPQAGAKAEDSAEVCSRSSSSMEPSQALRTQASSSAWGTLTWPGRLETTHSAKVMSLIRVLATWNVRLSDDSCCAFHEAIVEAVTILYDGQAAHCTGPSKAAETQCSRCRLVNIPISGDGGLCGHCADQHGGWSSRLAL